MPSDTYGISLFINVFISVYFLGAPREMAALLGLRHPFRTFIHKVIHSFCA